MSQTPNEPRDNDLGDSAQPANDPGPTADASSEPTVRYPRADENPGSSEQPTRSYPAASNPQTTPQPTQSQGHQDYGQHDHSTAHYGSPYGQSSTGYPVPPEKKPKDRKKFAGSTLVAGMVAAALVGGVTATGTTFLLNDDAGSSSVTSSPSKGVVINNPDQVTEVTAAAAKASPSVVTIEVSGNGSGGSGSGIILDNEGNILTNTHVVTLGGEVANPEISVQMNDGTVHSAKVVGTDPLSDLAVINIQADNLVPATLGSSADLNVGDTAVAIGAPLGLSGTVTDGIISTLNRTISVASSAVPKESDQAEGEDGNQFNFQFPGQEPQQQSAGSIYVNVIQTDAAINHGNSGGALVNSSGEIIGVNVAIASAGNSEEGGSIGVGFAIPIDYAQRVAQELIENGEATHGLLGATVAAQPASTGGQQGSSSFSVGARVVEISSGSAAEKAGLKADDVITGVNGRAVQDSQTVTAAIREIPAGGEAEITYLRNGQEHTATATVGSLSKN